MPPTYSTRKSRSKTNPRREAFIHQFLETGNATGAAILAGYCEEPAARSRPLTIPEIKGPIDTVKRVRRTDLEAPYTPVDSMENIVLPAELCLNHSPRKHEVLVVNTNEVPIFSSSIGTLYRSHRRRVPGTTWLNIPVVC